MRMVLIVSALALSACASAAPPENSASELARLTADCRARGGILVPSGRPLEGRPTVDNFCQIRGATRVSPDGAR
jgi:hypothetical protein